MSQYIRCKRKNQTVFLHVETFTTFQDIKKQLGDNFSVEPEKIMLWASDKKRELVDLATIADHEIKNDDVVYMCFMKDTGGWEDPQADSLQGLPEQAAEA